MATIGFIGLGVMGTPMARRLIGGGARLVVHDVRDDERAGIEALGARWADSVTAVADAAETVFVSLPTPPIVEAVLAGDDGVIAGSAVKRTVDLSTTGATTSQRIAETLAQKAITHLDAPVSGGRQGAEKGTLAVMASGPRQHYDVIEPMLKDIGRPFYVGDAAGLGQTMKLVNNLLSATAMAATAEAVVMAVKAGIDPTVACDVINAGSGRNSASQDKFPKSIIPRTFDYGFTTGLMYKDLRLCMSEAEALGVQMLVASSVKQLWQMVQAELGPQSDFTEIVKLPEGWAGVTVGNGA